MIDFTHTDAEAWQPMMLLEQGHPYNGGLAPGDANFITQQLAASRDCGLVLAPVMKAAFIHQRMPEAGAPPFDRPIVMFSGVKAQPETGDATLLQAIGAYLTALHQQLPAESLPRQYLLPVTLPPSATKRGHAVLMVLDWVPDERRFHVSVLEQHVNPHDAPRNFTAECTWLGQRMAQTMQAPLHFNTQPFCRVPQVCALVRAEAMNTIARSGQPGYYFAENPELLAVAEATLQQAYAQYATQARRAQPLPPQHQQSAYPDFGPLLQRAVQDPEWVKRLQQMGNAPVPRGRA